MPTRTIAIVGASSSDHPFSFNVGGRVAQALMAQGAHVKILTRQDRTETPKIKQLKQEGSEIVIVDYARPDTLDTALKGVDIVVSALAHGGMANQLALAESAKRMGCRLFMPSEWGSNSADLPTDHPVYEKRAFQDTLAKLEMPALILYPGPFAEVFPALVGPKAGKIMLPGGGKTLIGTTCLDDISKYVGYILTSLPIDQLQNRLLVIEGTRTTLADIAAFYQKRDPSIIVETEPLEKVKQRGKEGDMIAALVGRWHETPEGGLNGTPEQIKESTSLYPSWDPKPLWDFL